MAPHPADSGDLSHNSVDDHGRAGHRSAVPPAPATISSVSGAARSGRLFYSTLSASSVGLELGLSVVFGVLFGRWLDGKLGTAPWMMLLLLALGLVAGFRSVMRAVHRADRAAEAEARRG
jgi:F0F1-type ATP synthase assembly protein I